ncbi:unnamed protein product [Leuciscus chuanchicus]
MFYLIVEFEGEGTTGPIAKSWYADGYSWWPPYKDLDRVLKSVRTMEEPQPEKGWTRHRTRILHEKKTCSDNIYSSDDEAPEPPPLKKRKTADKESVPPAPKPPALPKRTKKKEHTFSVLRTSGDNQGRTRTPVGVSQAEHHGAGWGVDPPNTQAPVGVSQAEHHGAGWGVDPPNTQVQTFSVLRPSGNHQGREESIFYQNPVLSIVPPRAILETLEKMDMKINHLTSLVQSLVGNRRILPQMQSDEEDDVFPIASIEDLDRLEQSLVDRGLCREW